MVDRAYSSGQGQPLQRPTRSRRVGALLRTRHRVKNRVLYGTTIGLSANRLLRGQLAYMRTAGWDVHVVSSPDRELSAAAEREAVKAHALPMRREISPLQDLHSLIRWLLLLLRLRPAITNVSTPKAALLGSIAAFATRVPRRIYVIRGLRLEGTSGALRRILTALEKLTIALSTDLVAVSHSLSDVLRDEGLVKPGRTIHVIGAGSSNGVDIEGVRSARDDAKKDSLRDELGLTERTVIGYLGRLSADKGIDTLARAISQDALSTRTDWSLLCVGGTESEGVVEPLSDTGVHVVHVNHTQEPWKYLAIMDILCLPTRREGFPNVVLEAACLGIPTVTTDATGAVDSVIDEVTGYIVPVDDFAAMSSRLNSLVGDQRLRSQMGGAARERVEREFTNETIWQGLHALYSAGQH